MAGIGLTAVCLVVIGFSIHAQKENTGLTVHPSNFDLSAKPGTTVPKEIFVDNHSNQAVAITVNLKNFTAQGEEGSVNLTDQDNSYALAKWITVTPSTATIPAHGSQKFTFTINIPVTAEAGGHFGSIVFATVPPKDVKGSGAILSQQIASLILMRIPGNVNEQAEVVSLTTDKPFYEFGPVNFDMRVKNNGNIHIQPFGSLQVKNMLGQTVDVPIEPRNILPGAIRKIPATLSNKFLLGKYTVSVTASYGSKNQPLVGYVTFYAFPVRYGAIAFIVLLILFLLRKRLGKAIKMLVTGK